MKHLSKILFFLMLSFAVISCKEEDEPVLPIISGFSPGNGPVTTQITIFGANFSNPRVKFGSIDATVISSTPVQIVTTVPTGATTGKITVTNGDGQIVTSTNDFVVGGFPQQVVGNGPAGTVTEITTNTTWTADKRYLIRGTIVVSNNATLTINAGTVIFGDKATRGTLVISRGAKLVAEGNAGSPIVFTSSQPRGERAYGDWGGILIAGRAANNQSTDQQFEGLPDDARFKYGIGTGGSIPGDNSGSLKFVRIEFSGIAISDGNETNGLTLGSVGSGTTLENIQVSFCGDDSFEWFGGTVNARNLIAFRGWDDDFDVDFGHSGKVQFGLAYRDPFIADQSQSNGFECDNSSSGAGTPVTSAVFSNITYLGPERQARGLINPSNNAPFTSQGVQNANYGRAVHLRRNTSVSIFNSVFVGGALAGLSLDGSAVQGKFENANGTTAEADQIHFRGNVFAGTWSASLPARGGAFAFETPFAAAVDPQLASFNANNSTSALADLKFAANFLTWGTAGVNATALGTNLLPANDSPLLTGAVFTGKAATGFTSVNYKGAFGATNWATGWTNFDPQNTDY
ncbi:MAG: IPT/TIG domain-containing protein [Microscillaceae bacterium]|jgi:hypothetical protein|nr:IPT/TIG domain-containing protein [Microscillaceae bacterium]